MVSGPAGDAPLQAVVSQKPSDGKNGFVGQGQYYIFFDIKA
jgi:hypothetical protein